MVIGVRALRPPQGEIEAGIKILCSAPGTTFSIAGYLAGVGAVEPGTAHSGLEATGVER